MESDDCEFDSTWEDEHQNKTPRKKMYRRSRRNMYAAKDMQDFRHSCQFLDYDDEEPVRDFYNLEFYQGRIRSSPDSIGGVNIVGWKKFTPMFNGARVEQVVTCAHKKGNKDTGEVRRASNWRQRFKNLNRYTHNNLRITRILKCLGTLGLEHYQAPLVKFFLHETLVNGNLPSVRQSVLDYFIFAVLDKAKRRELVRYAYEHFRPREDFVWGPKKILQKETSKEGEQERVMTHKTMPGMNKTHARPYPLERMGSEKLHKNYHQKDGKAVSRNTFTVTEKRRIGGNARCLCF
ncbi:opioid growth factor receptor-like isoform X2 [Danio aesculapii]|uniref:opioid growth factor receptor-like isoform X2 n=1 Tax=Danio aesculapii TaxID=1142201 RepID=UPI0024BF8AF6|nr:opioid growth factor receptor-like isoform X2 [Danio aesculapii]